MLRKFLVAAGLMIFAAEVHAATLSYVEGLVFIDRGSGDQPATTGDYVGPGDRVHTTSGTVNVVYSNGYVMPVGQNQTAVVLASPPAPAGAGGEGAAAWAPASSDIWIAGGIVALGAGVSAAVLANSSSKPASP
jgi:hypothetical protein